MRISFKFLGALIALTFHVQGNQAQPSTSKENFLARLRETSGKIHEHLYRNIEIKNVITEFYPDNVNVPAQRSTTHHWADHQSSRLTSTNEKLLETTHHLIRPDAEYVVTETAGPKYKLTKSQVVPDVMQDLVARTPRYRFNIFSFTSGLGFGLTHWEEDFYSMFTEITDRYDGSKWVFEITDLNESVESQIPCLHVTTPPAKQLAAGFKKGPGEASPFLKYEFFFHRDSLICFKIKTHVEKGVSMTAMTAEGLDKVETFVPKRIETSFQWKGKNAWETRRVISVESFQKKTPDRSIFRLEQFGFPDIAEKASERRGFGFMTAIILAMVLVAVLFGIRTVIVRIAKPSGPAITRPHGWSLIELLIVIAIIAVFMALLIPAVQSVRNSAAMSRCQNQLKQIGLSLQSYHDRTGRFPIGHQQREYAPKLHAASDQTWAAAILPDLGESPLWESTVLAYRQTQNFTTVPPHVGLTTPLTVFHCPSDDRVRGVRRSKTYGIDVALMSYQGVAGRRAALRNGVLFNQNSVRIADVTDGASTTLLVGERPPDPRFDLGWWYAGFGIDGFGTFDSVMGVAEYDPGAGMNSPTICGSPTVHYKAAKGFHDPCGPYHFWSPHAGGANFAMVDGSVKWIRYSAESVLVDLSTRAGHEAAPAIE